MPNASAGPTGDVEAVVHTYGDLLFRLCLVMLGNEADGEDAVQDTMIKYMQKAPAFEDTEHEKAWLITVATNRCRDMQRFRLRHPHIGLEEIQAFAPDAQSSGILEALVQLPEKFKLVLALYYVEGYSVNEIASIISRTPSAVKMRLQKGRRLLEARYRKEFLS